MNEQNIMENEAVEVAEEFVPNGSGIGLKVIGGIAVVVGLTYGACKLYKKLKAKKEHKDEDSTIYGEAKEMNVDED